MSYTNQTLISNYLQRALTADEIAFLAVLLPAIKTWIDNKTGSTFDEANATTRFFDGGGSTVDLDPCTDVTAVSSLNNDGTNSYDYVSLQDYVLEPQNEVVKREIVRRSGRFPSGLRRISVTAKFSEYDGAVPADIQLIATRIAALLMNEGRISSTANVDSESLEGHSITYKSSQSDINTVAMDDPLIVSTLDQRRELLIG